MGTKEICRNFEIFLHNIVWLRKHYRLSKKGMAQILGISVWSLNKLENGEIPPKLKIDIVFSIQDHFGIHPKDLFDHALGSYHFPQKTARC